MVAQSPEPGPMTKMHLFFTITLTLLTMKPREAIDKALAKKYPRHNKRIWT